MGREQLMAQQRARVLAMRARKLAEKKAAEAAKKLAAKDAKRIAPTEPLKGKEAEAALNKFLEKRTKEQPKKEAIKSKQNPPSPKAQPSTSTKTGGTKPVQQAKSRVPQRFADGGKGGKYAKAVENKEKAKSNFFRSSSGTRGENVSPNPKLKSQPTKPKRSSFPAGRAGATEYAAALAKYRKLLARISKVRPQTNRRGRAI